MELEELKANWKSVNARLDEMQSVQVAMQQTILRSHNRAAANKLKIEPIFELIVGCLTAIWTGNFLADNFAKVLRSPLFAVPGGLLDALAIFTIWLSLRQLIIVSALDYSKPIVETQKMIAKLKSLKVRSTQFTMLIGLPLWVIFPLVAGQAIFGFEFVRAVNGPWILANLAFGVLVSAGIILVARKYGEQSLFFRKISDVMAGTEIAKAQKLLAEVNNFERS